MDRPTQKETFVGKTDEFDLRQILGQFLEKKWFIAGCLVLCLLAGLAYLKFTPPIYEAATLVEVRQKRPVASFENFQDQDSGSDEVVKTLERLLKRDSLYRRVMENPEIQENTELRQSLDRPMEEIDLQEQGEMLKDWTTVRLERGTHLIAISVQHTKPSVAQKLATTIVNEFLEEKDELRRESWASALEELAGEEERAGKELTESQSILQGLDALTETQEKIEDQNDVIADLLKSKAEDHPEVKNARALLAKLYGNLEKKIAKVWPHFPEAAPGNGENGNLSREEKLDAGYEQLFKYHPEISVQVERDRAVFDSVLRSRREIDVTMRLAAIPIDVVEEASRPREPVKPNKIQVVAASIILGGGLGLALAWGLSAMNRSLRSVDEAERLLQLPVLGAIPEDNRLPDAKWLARPKNRNLSELKRLHAEGAGTSRGRKSSRSVIEPLVMLSDPGCPISEAFRTLRASLTLMNRKGGKKLRSLLITSSVSGEGKSFVAANLAIAFAAQEGRRTLLIDADLRKPMIDSLFALESEGGSLTEALTSGNVQVIGSGIENLDLLPAGRGAHRPAELLSANMMDRLVAGLSENYEQIIFDSAPVNTVADALLLAPHVDASLLVARAGNTPRAAIQHARDQLADAGVIPTGIVLNRLPVKAGLAANPYFYYYDAESQKYGESYR